MDINVFREFAEVVLQGSYSAAAKALNLSQPTLSRHVGALEKELNVKLVADILPVRLTPAGDTVLQTALRMDDLYTGMQDELANCAVWRPRASASTTRPRSGRCPRDSRPQRTERYAHIRAPSWSTWHRPRERRRERRWPRTFATWRSRSW